MIEWLPHINASLNSLAAVLLVAGYVLIRRGREQAHKVTMLSCFGVSCAFLACYLVYHFNVISKRFPDYPPDWVRYFYYFILLTHVVLAISVPFLAVTVIVMGFRDWRKSHRRWARVTLPIWLYVSVTGVIVYLMLYQLYPPR